MTQAHYFIISSDSLLVKEQDGKLTLPERAEIVKHLELNNLSRIGGTGGLDDIAASINDDQMPLKLPAGFDFIKLRQLFGVLDDETYRIALRAAHIVNWRKNTRHCGRCGGRMIDVAAELAVQCTKCGFIVYPRISPAIIVAVAKGKQILLARSSRFPAGRFSVIAGFLEPGETLEECVRREVKEEVGIDVDLIRYFDSQPWPYPDSLMVGFTAEYAGGELAIDNNEVVAAGWFTADALPDIPPKDSIARRLIDQFVRSSVV